MSDMTAARSIDEENERLRAENARLRRELRRLKGRRAQKKAVPFRASGYQVLFALLAWPDLADATVRELGDYAGVSKSGAATALNHLRSEGAIHTLRGRLTFRRTERLLDRWQTGYEDLVSPRLFGGAYPLQWRTEDWLEKVSAWMQRTQRDWAFGGTQGAHAVLGPTLHDDQLDIWLDFDRSEDPSRVIRMTEHQKGDLRLWRTPSPHWVTDNQVPPLLSYTQLRAIGTPRHLELAAALREEAPEYFP